ncbi:putative zinc finger protein [Orchesella cincta]|uniref:Putative zinc finger protein n=1 Tax=Orchesella cincta TaxID=48709 RepID=A0A1D2N4B2_ORCCI|nr:putative zinc finger protein [Orchesella cincta]
MATTATLNGGPTGGLHATPTLIHSENPPQEETCRVESNSSFESGNDEILLQHGGAIPEDNPNAWSTCEGLDRAYDSESQAWITRTQLNYRKREREKTIRPVRIPATELSLTAREHGSLLSESAGTGSEGDEAGELSSERELYNPDGKPVRGSHKQEKSDDEEGVLQNSRQQLPLNLTGKYEQFDSESGGQQQCLLAAQSSVLTSCLSGQPAGNNSSIETEKTEAAGQGTKSSPSPLSRVVPGSGSPNNPRQVSPPLFSVSSSSPFSAIFPSASGNPVSNYFQQQSHSQSMGSGLHHHSATSNPPPGTPNSTTSSTGSNQNGQGGSTVSNLPPHRIFNPEAYCDLCNKEFCNKYFLKTHKANKHGVYSEVSSASLTSNQLLAAAISSSPSSNSFLSISHGNATNPLSHSQSVPQQTITSSASSLLKISSSMVDTSFTASYTGGDKSCSSSNNGSSQQRESFCELCQKEFCNKYFLKRHKAKIHGIPMPAEHVVGKSGSSSSGKSSRTGFSNGMSESVKREETIPGLPTLRDIGLETLGLDLVTKHLEASAGNSGQGESGQREDAEIANSDESNAPPNSLNSFHSELMSAGENARLRSPENLGENSSFKLSSLELKPQQLGNVNAENTCQFCFRDFPSQQLLRSHIIKKHRLLLQSAFPPFLLSFQPIPSAFDDQTAEPTILDSNGNTTEMDYECNICNRSFQTIYLLRMHKSYFHPDSEQESSDPLTTKLMSEAASIFNQTGGKSSNGREENEGDTDQGFDSDAEGEVKSESANKSAANVEMENRGEATSDSDDLRRLQTMIMELNRVSTTAVAWSPPMGNVSTSPTAPQFTGQTTIGSSLVCPICSKEFYSSYFLQQHIQHYHSSAAAVNLAEAQQAGAVRVKIESPLGEINSNVSKKMTDTGSISGSSGSSNSQLQKDRLEGTGTDSANLLNNPTFLTPGPKGSGSGNPIKTETGGGGGGSGGSITGSSGAKRPSPSLSRSYCTICHKELCNKYFMRTHMLKMHGISIESSTGLGGVTCDICNKELCSKYFLKVHKQNTHGIIEDGPSPPNPSTPGPSPQPLANFPIVTPPIMNLTTGGNEAGSPLGQADISSALLPKDQNERYFNHFSEQCPLCGRRFRSSKWLKSHLQSDHGSEGRERWKSIEKSLGLQRRSPKMSKSSGSMSKSSGNGNSGKGSSSSSQKHSSTKDGNKCALCGFSSGDAEVMRSHLIKEHGNQLSTGHGVLGESLASNFAEGSPGLVLDPLTMLFQKMEGGSNKLYRCSYCPFTTSLLVYLYAHERTHTGLANSVTNQNPVTQDAKCPFQCPMCFHTFQQPDAFQQHLIGHQMSGVLAPFFTPSLRAAASSSGFILLSVSPLLSLAPTENESSGEPGGSLLSSLPLLNGGSGNSSLYLALNANKAQVTPYDDDDTKKSDHEDDGAADLTTTKRQLVDACEATPRKLPKMISHYTCTCCQRQFKTRELCVSHIREEHKGKRVVFKVISAPLKRRGIINRLPHHHQHPLTSCDHASRQKKIFRCRKCKFTCSTYTSLMVHSKLQHSFIRPGPMNTVVSFTFFSFFF